VADPVGGGGYAVGAGTVEALCGHVEGRATTEQ
jgi:hypothetical protein